MNKIEEINGASGEALDPLPAIVSRKAVAAVIGLGYVGLPLLAAAAQAGFASIGFDIDADKPARIAAGSSYVDAVPPALLKALVGTGRLTATTNFKELQRCHVIAI